MYTILTNRRDDKDRDEGFTLIELMVVVLLIAILLAIAIPTFLGAQTKAKDRGAQSSARMALTTAKTIYADEGSYAGVTIAKLAAIEPGLKWAATSTTSKTVSVAVTATEFYAVVKSDTGQCYYVRDSVNPDTAIAPGPGTSYKKGAATAGTAPAPDSCTATAAATSFTEVGWDG